MRAEQVIADTVMERFRARLPGLIRELAREVMLAKLERAGLEPECLERVRRALAWPQTLG